MDSKELKALIISTYRAEYLGENYTKFKDNTSIVRGTAAVLSCGSLLFAGLSLLAVGVPTAATAPLLLTFFGTGLMGAAVVGVTNLIDEIRENRIEKKLEEDFANGKLQQRFLKEVVAKSKRDTKELCASKAITARDADKNFKTLKSISALLRRNLSSSFAASAGKPAVTVSIVKAAPQLQKQNILG